MGSLFAYFVAEVYLYSALGDLSLTVRGSVAMLLYEDYSSDVHSSPHVQWHFTILMKSVEYKKQQPAIIK